MRRAAGMGLLVLGGVGFFYSLRVAAVQIRYQQLKFGGGEASWPDVVVAAKVLDQRYRHNYHMSVWLADTAWHTHGDTAVARDWVQRGLSQNPYHLELRWLDTVLIGMDDPVRAAQMWEAYSDEVFWNRWVLAGRVYWLAYAGRLAEAEQFMQLLRQEPGDYRWVEEALVDVRAQQLPE